MSGKPVFWIYSGHPDADAEQETLVFAKKSKPTTVDDSEEVEIQLKLKVQDIVKSSWGNPIIVNSLSL